MTPQTVDIVNNALGKMKGRGARNLVDWSWDANGFAHDFCLSHPQQGRSLLMLDHHDLTGNGALVNPAQQIIALNNN